MEGKSESKAELRLKHKSPSPPSPPKPARKPTIKKKRRKPKLLGEGGYGKVLLINGTAVKLLNKAYAWIHERVSYTALQGEPNIVKPDLSSSNFVERKLAMTPYMTTVRKFVTALTTNEKFAALRPTLPAILYQIATDIARGLHAIHRRGLVHGDITPKNLLIRKANFQSKRNHFEAYIVDLGLLAPIGFAKVSYSPAPYREEHSKPDTKHDIYSFGVVLVEIFSGKRIRSANATYDTLTSYIRRKLPSSVRTFVAKMVHPVREKRPKASEVWKFFSKLLQAAGETDIPLLVKQEEEEEEEVKEVYFESN